MGMIWAPQQAAPVALIAVAGSADEKEVEAWRKGLVRYRATIVMMLSGLPMKGVWLFVAQRSSPTLMILLFTGVMLTVAWRLMRTPVRAVTHTNPIALDKQTGRFF